MIQLHLRPFDPIPGVSMMVEIDQIGSTLNLLYQISGERERFYWPDPIANPERRHELWTSTCLELFLAGRGLPHYYEFNFSPCGDWNIYHLENYRSGMTEELTVSPPVLRSRPYELEVSIDLSPLELGGGAVDANITAVLPAVDGTDTFWALYHDGFEADFHLRDGFVLSLESWTLPTG